MPANVSLNDLAMVTAGFANDVDEVNQYAAVMYAPTANGTAIDRSREHPQITDNKPKLATNSLRNWAGPLRTWFEMEMAGRPNIVCARRVPVTPPRICTGTYADASARVSPPSMAAASVTAGLKCAPEIEPNV